MKLKFGSQPDRLLLREFPAFVVNRRTEQSFLYYDAADLSYTYEAESLG